MIFSRLMSALCADSGSENASTRLPSTRNRMRRRSSSGSMWMSELRSRSAWPTILPTNCTTGAWSSRLTSAIVSAA